jgi:putative oxidoreductase
MVIAYVRSHMFEGLMPIQNRGELALLYLLVFLFFAVRGAGPLSLDGWIRSRKGEATAPQGAGF